MTRTLLLILRDFSYRPARRLRRQPLGPDSDPLFFGDKRWSFDVKDNWKPVSKKCNDVEVPPKDLGRRISSTASSASSGSQVQRGRGVDLQGRLSLQPDSVLFRLDRVDLPRGFRRALVPSFGECEKDLLEKERGKTNGYSHLRRVFDFGPEEMGLTLAATEDEIGLKLTGSPDCPGGTLQMTLHK